MKKVLGFAVALTGASDVAMAHEGAHDMGVADAVAHMLSSPYHLGVLAVVAVVAVGIARFVMGRGKARR